MHMQPTGPWSMQPPPVLTHAPQRARRSRSLRCDLGSQRQQRGRPRGTRSIPRRHFRSCSGAIEIGPRCILVARTCKGRGGAIKATSRMRSGVLLGRGLVALGRQPRSLHVRHHLHTCRMSAACLRICTSASMRAPHKHSIGSKHNVFVEIQHHRGPPPCGSDSAQNTQLGSALEAGAHTTLPSPSSPGPTRPPLLPLLWKPPTGPRLHHMVVPPPGSPLSRAAP